MRVKNIIWEDTVNYRKPSLFIGTAECSYKCGADVCQNAELSEAPDIEVDERELLEKYLDNPLTTAIVLGGLEPLDQLADLAELCSMMNILNVTDDLVIYTGYTEEEAEKQVRFLRNLNCGFRNLIVKYGRYISDSESRFDPVLCVSLASDNQHAIMYPRR